MEKIRVLIVESAFDPYVKEIENTLQAKQKIVGGLLEFVDITNDVICGTFIIAGQENGNTVSLTEKQIKKYKKYFNTRKHTIPIALLRNMYPESSMLLQCNLTGIEKMLDLGK